MVLSGLSVMPSVSYLAAAVGVFSALALLVNQRVPLSTTVIILNWSRFPNVKKITSTVCQNLLEDVVDAIIVWNNNPIPIALSDFDNTTCPEGKLRIVNSHENLYFQARYTACAQAQTPYCFIQDDDFLVLPEIIRAMARRAKEASLSSIHLQPADEMLSSQVRTISIEPNIHTTFAWLGYGTIITRKAAMEFLTLLDKLNLSLEEHQMADNYFTILSNKVPERWFEPGIPLGGGVPFTVGSEGEERNNHHILRAAALLDAVKNSSETHKELPYINLSPRAIDSTVSRAPCHGTGRLCVFETSIKLLSDIGLETSMSAATEILDLEKTRVQKLKQKEKDHYLGFPPSSAVDGRNNTAFRSLENAKKDEWVTLDLTEILSDRLEFVLVAAQAMGAVLRNAAFEASRDGNIWDDHTSYLNCEALPDHLMECLAVFESTNVRYFRLRCLKDLEAKWAVHEMYVYVGTHGGE